MANYVADPVGRSYWEKAVCEKSEGKACYLASINRDVSSIQDVEVDDPSKPILEFKDPIEVCNDEKECLPSCEVPFELKEGRCVSIIGYEKMIEQQLVVDPVRLAQKEALAAESAAKEAARAAACRGFRTAIENMTLSANAPAAALETATRNMFGFIKNCQ